MIRAKAHFKIELPTKPFLKKYLISLCGEPLTLSVDNAVGMMISSMLEKKSSQVYPTFTREIIHQAFDKYNDRVTIFLPKSWMDNYYYGTGLSEKKVVYINKFIEMLFEKEMVDYCEFRCAIKGDRQEALYAFCEKHNIEVPDDITFDNLKQTEYRYRKALKKRSAQPEENPSILSPKSGTFTQKSLF